MGLLCLTYTKIGGTAMTPFMNKVFLLKSDTARVLYHQHAALVPVIDYHCHINPQ